MYFKQLQYINAKYGTNFTNINQIPPFVLEGIIPNNNNGITQLLKNFFKEITIEKPHDQINNQINNQTQNIIDQKSSQFFQNGQLLTNHDLETLINAKTQEIFAEFLDENKLRSVFVPKSETKHANVNESFKIFRNDMKDGNVGFTFNQNSINNNHSGDVNNDLDYVNNNSGDVNNDLDYVNNNSGDVNNDLDYEKKNEKDKSFEEYLYKKKFSDVLTTFVNSEKIFCDENITFIVRFQYLIITLFTNLFFAYTRHTKLDENDIKFIYKGGTTMKIVYSQYTNLMEQCNCDNFKANIAKYFDRSDSDYEIKINKKFMGNKYNNIYYDIARLTILILKHIKIILIMHDKFFMDRQQNITPLDLKNLINNLNNTLEDIKTKTNSDYFKNVKKIVGLQTGDVSFISPEHIHNVKLYNRATKRDYFITKNNLDNEDEQNTFVGHLKYKPETDFDNELFISSNEVLKFVQKTHDIPYTETFLLSRLKQKFLIYYVKDNGTYSYFNSYSEIIDVSMSKQNSSANERTTDDMFTSYRYTFKKNTSEQLCVQYIGYSIKGFLSDLLIIFFFKSVYPWEDKKYEKRLYRFLFFVYVELVQLKLLTNETLDFVINIINDQSTINNNITNYPRHETLKNTMMYSFLEKIVSIKTAINNTTNNTIKIKLTAEYDTFKNILLTTFNELKHNTNQNVTNVTNCGVAPCDVTQLGGNFNRKKYLKYLNKNKQILKLIEKNML